LIKGGYYARMPGMSYNERTVFRIKQKGRWNMVVLEFPITAQVYQGPGREFPQGLREHLKT